MTGQSLKHYKPAWTQWPSVLFSSLNFIMQCMCLFRSRKASYFLDAWVHAQFCSVWKHSHHFLVNYIVGIRKSRDFVLPTPLPRYFSLLLSALRDMSTTSKGGPLHASLSPHSSAKYRSMALLRSGFLKALSQERPHRFLSILGWIGWKTQFLERILGNADSVGEAWQGSAASFCLQSTPSQHRIRTAPEHEHTGMTWYQSAALKNCCAFPFIARCPSGRAIEETKTKPKSSCKRQLESTQVATPTTELLTSATCSFQHIQEYEILGQRHSARGITERMNLKLKHCSASCPRMISKLPLTHATFDNWHGVAHFMSSAGCRSEFQNHKTEKWPHDFVNSLDSTPSDKSVEPAD